MYLQTTKINFVMGTFKIFIETIPKYNLELLLHNTT